MRASDFANEQPCMPDRFPNHTMGGASGQRLISVLLATGGYALLAAGVLLLPFVLSPYAIQNDVYLGNYFLAPLFGVSGASGVAVGLLLLKRSGAQGADVRRGRRLALLTQALLLAVAGAAAAVVATFVVGGRYYSYGPHAPTWLPYLSLPLLGVAIAIAAVVALVAWVWQWKPAAPTDRAGTRQSGQ